jgi:hypothetical protein
LVVYDCRVEPKRTDRASAARLLYLTIDDYVSRWDDIYDIFSREAVWRGLFDTFAFESTKKRGTSTVDRVFLSEMDSWREALARSLAASNDLTQRELNYAVQQTIDRIIFLRICEDRGIESYGELEGLLRVRSGVYEGSGRAWPRCHPAVSAATSRADV